MSHSKIDSERVGTVLIRLQGDLDMQVATGRVCASWQFQPAKIGRVARIVSSGLESRESGTGRIVRHGSFDRRRL